MSKERFFEMTCDEPFYMAIVIAINPEVLTVTACNEINEFYSHHKRRLEMCDGDIYLVVSRMFAGTFFRWAVEQGGGVYGSRGAEGWLKSWHAWVSEGWPPLDELGMRIVSAEVNFDYPCFDNVDVAEVGEPDGVDE